VVVEKSRQWIRVNQVMADVKKIHRSRQVAEANVIDQWR
jgi:hypothetical protein